MAPLEREAKLPVDGLAPVRARLERLGATPRGRIQQHDVLYDFADGRIAAAGGALRLRQTAQGAWLTYKGPVAAGAYKTRPEFESAVGDAAAIRATLDALGLRVRLSYRKVRETWNFRGCDVCLDELADLGAFVEVEGPDAQAITRALHALALDPGTHIDASYPELVAAHCARYGRDPASWVPPNAPGDG